LPQLKKKIQDALSNHPRRNLRSHHHCLSGPPRSDSRRRNRKPGSGYGNNLHWPISVRLLLPIPSSLLTSHSTLVDHDINVALLSICGGISGTIEQCGGEPTTTTGESGTAKFTLNAATVGQTIDVTKGRWEGCVRAARATCGDSPFTSTCIGGADGNAGNVDFALTASTQGENCWGIEDWKGKQISKF
jgi:hypothetical protein